MIVENHPRGKFWADRTNNEKLTFEEFAHLIFTFVFFIYVLLFHSDKCVFASFVRYFYDQNLFYTL